MQSNYQGNITTESDQYDDKSIQKIACTTGNGTQTFDFSDQLCGQYDYSSDTSLYFSTKGVHKEANFENDAFAFGEGNNVSLFSRSSGYILSNGTFASTDVIATGTKVNGSAASASQGYTSDGNASALATAQGANFLALLAIASAQDNAPDIAIAIGSAGGEDANASVYASTSQASYGFEATADNVSISVAIIGDQITSRSNAEGNNVTAGFQSVTPTSLAVGDAQGDDITFSVDAEENGMSVMAEAVGEPTLVSNSPSNNLTHSVPQKNS
eukprot:TRINITY_DN28475_c0_g4_i1.p1 TRINITY_DN28475_c0_g4~~TRINITY_DN28475_c0_g4_i1.p1  ORF type:complete len:293 (-),score=49.75 TRINITY_DN28475_c0_g4_i1:157-969(-)